jgi:transposase-like protein/IS1 family transposase
MQIEFNSLIELNKKLPDEDAAVAHFAAMRWKDGEFCFHCGVEGPLYRYADKRLYKCPHCHERFSIRYGTIFEDSRLPLRTWMLAIWYVSSHKKGIASTQLAKDLGVTQKTAWFMMHRLRHAARTRSFNRPLDGDVEVDETFVGGKAKNRHKDKRGNSGTTGGDGKAIVAGAVQRKGRVIAQVVENVRADTLTEFVRQAVSTNVDLVVTDKWVGYKHLGKEFPHAVIDHAQGEYVRGKAHTNTIEGYWSQLKRQIFGIHHWVSGKHLGRYVDESAWRYNRRGTDDAPRFNEFLLELVGAHLTYKDLIA